MSELLADRVREELRTRIIDGRYAQGSRLTDEQIIRDLTTGKGKDRPFESLSSAPVREALIALEAEHLIEIVARVGTMVRRVTEQEALELLYSRMAIEEFVVSQLAAMKEEKVDLSRARAANERLRRRAATAAPPAAVAAGVKRAIIEADTTFHEELARAAGYPRLADELLRLRRQIAVFSQSRMSLTGDHLRQFADEHDAILAALRGRDGMRPDVNEVRNATRRHLKHSAIRWALQPDGVMRNSHYRNVIFDLPDIPRNDTEDRKLRFDLLAARVTIELLALKRLAALPAIRLDAAEELNREMEDLTEQHATANAKERVRIQTRFVNADIGFHTALTFLTGLQFAEETVVHFWQRFYAPAKLTLTAEHMHDVVAEHDALLGAIRPARGLAGDPEAVAHSYLTHILSALDITKHQLDDGAAILDRFLGLGAALADGWRREADRWLKVRRSAAVTKARPKRLGT